MRILSSTLLGTAAAAVLAAPVNAKRFENSYVSFEVPNDWTCELDGTEWTCSPPKNVEGRVGMMVVLTAKCVGPSDSPQLYLRHLEDVARRPGVETTVPSERRLIGGTLWLDGTLRHAEMRNYDTRYLVRNEGDLGVLVTFSSLARLEKSAKPISDAIAASVVVNSSTARPELRGAPLPVCKD